jgi:hypothetical protein
MHTEPRDRSFKKRIAQPARRRGRRVGTLCPGVECLENRLLLTAQLSSTQAHAQGQQNSINHQSGSVPTPVTPRGAVILSEALAASANSQTSVTSALATTPLAQNLSAEAPPVSFQNWGPAISPSAFGNPVTGSAFGGYIPTSVPGLGNPSAATPGVLAGATSMSTDLSEPLGPASVASALPRSALPDGIESGLSPAGVDSSTPALSAAWGVFSDPALLFEEMALLATG